jgi:hypothetical protein
VLQRVHHFDEGWARTTSIRSGTSNVGLRKSKSDVLRSARAALRLLTGSSLTLQFALGLGAVGGLDAFVEASELFADRLALWFWSFAGGVAVSRLAN